MADLCPSVRQRFFDANGSPLSGGKLYSYVAGTSTPLTTYTDSSGATPNANPVILDSEGYADVWLGGGNHKLVLTDSNDVTQWTVDDVAASPGGGGGSSVGWVTYNVTDGQAATDLSGETVDLASYSSAIYEYEIIRGTTVIHNGHFSIQGLNGTGRVVTGLGMAEEPHGVTFSVSQATTVVQLRAALDSGAGNGTIKLIRKLITA